VAARSGEFGRVVVLEVRRNMTTLRVRVRPRDYFFQYR
jgi:hypothetical protein